MRSAPYHCAAPFCLRAHSKNHGPSDAALGKDLTLMKIARRFTQQGKDALSSVQYEQRISRITNPDGSVVFEMNDAEIPVQWSQLATDIMVSKYFRKAGVPQLDPATGQPL